MTAQRLSVQPRGALDEPTGMRWLLILMFAACAHDVRTHFPGSLDDSGTLVIMLTQPGSDVIVTIDGVLVVEEAHTDRIVIDHVPVGFRDLVVAAGGADRTVRVWVASDHATTVPLGLGDGSSSFVKTLFASLLTVVVYALLH